MTARVRHRGPDDDGHFIDRRVALGHRRLSIIDVSPLGHQPMTYAEGRYIISYNGEIYNYLEIREELAALGCEFRSRSDTEVILGAYATWGRDCLTRFNGMWAFAIYDREKEILFASRDRFGVKPLYYVDDDDCFAFGSEISQLLPLLPAVKANPVLISDYLLTGALRQTPETFFAGVKALLPGHWLEYDLKRERFLVQQFYSLPERVAGRRYPSSDANAVAKVRELLEDAVRLRLRSDVRVGTCLSGGVDSSAIAASAARMYGRASGGAFSAITAVSEDRRNSEEGYAEAVVRASQLDWIRTRPKYTEFRELLPRVVRHQEEPFPTPSICMQAFVMQAARENGVVVLLDGQGADETFLGYDKYYANYIIELWRNQGCLAALSGMEAATRNNMNMSSQRLAAMAVFMLMPSVRGQYYRLRAPYLRSKSLPEWVRTEARSVADDQHLQALEVTSGMLPALLRFEDRNSMAFSTETRLPFLDYRLVEHAISLSPGLKIRDGWTKWALRSAIDDIVPEEIAWRRRKIGFEAPTEMWVSYHQDVMVETIRSSGLLGRFCDMNHLLKSFGRLAPNHQWRLYGLAEWEKCFSVNC